MMRVVVKKLSLGQGRNTYPRSNVQGKSNINLRIVFLVFQVLESNEEMLSNTTLSFVITSLQVMCKVKVSPYVIGVDTTVCPLSSRCLGSISCLLATL